MYTASKALTALDLERAFTTMFEDRNHEPPIKLVTGSAWHRACEMKDYPRLSHYDLVELIAYAEVGATPPLRTASYVLGKSYRRAARRARRASKSATQAVRSPISW